MGQPLSGIRIVEMGQLIAIPFATKLLADMGAEVIRIESCSRLEEYRTYSLYDNDATGEYWNRAANFYEQNRNKFGITLDLETDKGIGLLKDIISISDVFAQNFTPRVVKKFGLEYESLSQIKPDIIMVSSTGYGHTGPWSQFGAIGYGTEAASGLTHMTGYECGPPVLPQIPHADFTAAEHTVFAIMTSLIHRASTGAGQFIDISQTETLSATIPEAMMDYSINGATKGRMGNQHSEMSPHGCYPCKGNDRWIAISIENDEEWINLCSVLGNPKLAIEPRFSNANNRYIHRKELDQLLTNSTSLRDQYELMKELQENKVPAGAVVNGKQLLFDPHLKARGFFETISHHVTTGIPTLPYPSRPWKMSKSKVMGSNPAPIMGEHNEQVICSLLGNTNEHLKSLENEGVVGYKPINPQSNTIPLEIQKRKGQIIEYDQNFRDEIHEHFGDL